MKIIRPDWYSRYGHRSHEVGLNDLNNWFQDWFSENVKPINKMLSEGVEVYSTTHTGHGKTWNSAQVMDDTHTALLINIRPVKKETAEDVLREFIEEAEHWFDGNSCDIKPSLVKRAKAALGDLNED